MTLGFFFRLLYVGLLRFIGLIALLIWYQNFEVSPLPAWTLDIFVVLVQFAWTYFCTRWVFRKLFPTPVMFRILLGVFLLGQVVLELWLTKRLTGSTWGATIKGAAHWGALLQIAIYSGAVYLGYWRAKKKRLAEHAADEVHLENIK